MKKKEFLERTALIARELRAGIVMERAVLGEAVLAILKEEGTLSSASLRIEIERRMRSHPQHDPFSQADYEAALKLLDASQTA